MRSVARLLACVALVALGCRRPPAPPAAEALPPLTVRTAQVETATAGRRQPVVGSIRPIEHATVAARVMGIVTRADFAVGQHVAAGETLVTLEAREIDARVVQARAQLNQAIRDHEREKALLAQGAATAEAVFSFAERQRAAAAALEEAETLLGYTRINAPFAGVITRDLVNPGDLASPGSPLFELEGIDRFRAEVQVPESLAALPLGTSLPVHTDTVAATGTLGELSPAADPFSRTRLAKIDLPSGTPVRSGDFARVLWPAGESQTVSVPAEAVTRFGQMERVFVVNSGRVRLRFVKTGAPANGRVDILAGLDAGETVVLAPPPTLRDGQVVEAVR